MPKAILELEIPESCWRCPCIQDRTKTYRWCGLDGGICPNPPYEKRRDDCPLKPVEDKQENEQLRAQVGKPTIEQVAWIAKCICQNADERGTFRHLIYDIMGYGGEAYQPLCEAGLLRINNSMTELTPEQVEALQQENEQLRKKGRKG